MLHPVRAKTFDHQDHSIFFHQNGKFNLPNPHQVRANRKMIQAYLYRIQQRVDRGYNRQAQYLFERIVTLMDLPRWAVLALKEEIRLPKMSKVAA